MASSFCRITFNSTVNNSDNLDLCLSFDEVSDDVCSGEIFMFVIQFFSVVLGLPANIMTVWVLVRHNEAASPSDVFILNLALMNILSCLGVPLDIADTFVDNIFTKASTFFFTFGQLGGPLFFSGLCAERYLAVVWATSYARFRDIQCRAACCATMWVFTLGISLLNTFKVKSEADQLNVCIVCFIPLLAIIVFCNIAILVVLRKSAPGVDTVHPIKKKAFKTVSVILVLMVIAYFPFVAIFPFHCLFSTIVYVNYVVPTCLSLSTTSVCAHALLYLYIMGKLPVGKMICCKKSAS